VHLRTVYMPQVEERIKAICFPYFRGDELINAKYRDREKNFRMEAGAERVLYGLNDLASRTVIVEGEIDKLSVEVAGTRACVSVPDGAPATNAKNYASKFTFLDTDALETVQEWIIAVDNDEPGCALSKSLCGASGLRNAVA
jgi:twinkle protein